MRQLPGAQLEIMEIIWESTYPISRTEIQEKLTQNHWKTTTINTLLSRLHENGFVRIDHQGKTYLYSPVIKKEAYKKAEGKRILKTLYDNSIKNFIVSVCDKNSLTEEEQNQLKQLAEKLKGEDLDD